MSLVEKLLTKERNMRNLNLEEYPHLHDTDLFKVMKYLPKCMVGGPWIAGGSVWRAVVNEPLKNCDIDVFFNSKTQFETACRQMNGYPFVNNILQETKNKANTTYKLHAHHRNFNKTIDVQFINMAYYRNINDLLESFDFTVCQFGWDGKNIVVNSTSVADLLEKKIKLWKVTRPKSLFKHLIKYIDNGFTVSSNDVRTLLRNVNDMNVWNKQALGDYDDEDNVKKAVVDDGWEGYGVTHTTATENRWATYAPTGYVTIQTDQPQMNTGLGRTHYTENATGVVDVTNYTPYNNVTTTAQNPVAEVPLTPTPAPDVPFMTPTPTLNELAAVGLQPVNPAINNVVEFRAATPEEMANREQVHRVRNLWNFPQEEQAPAQTAVGWAQTNAEIFTAPDPNITWANDAEVAETMNAAEVVRPGGRRLREIRDDGRVEGIRGQVERADEHTANRPYYGQPRTPRGPERFDEDRNNPRYAEAFNNEAQVTNNNGQENAQQERR